MLIFLTFLVIGVDGFIAVEKSDISNSTEYKIELEQALREELLEGYEPQQRPSKTVSIIVSLTLLTVNRLNIKQQTLTFSGYFGLTWMDERLAWENASSTTQNYTSVLYTFVAEKYIWKPAMIIENSVESLVIDPYDSVPLTISQDGKVFWNTAGVYKVTCESDTTYYPMDSQTCNIKISGWQYTVAEIRLSSAVVPVESYSYSENGEWLLLEMDDSTESVERKREGRAFSSITFVIKLQRRLLFHILHTLLPVTLMAILIPFVFKLPVDSGEKIGFSLTVLLSYAVYLTMISENIPSTSVTPCLLSVYLVFVLFMATIAVCCSALVINVYMTTENHTMSQKIKRFTTKYLMTMANLENRCSIRKNQVIDKSNTHFNPEKQGLPSSMTNLTDDTHDRDITWKELARIMDKVFYNIYMIITVTLTFILYTCIIYGYIQN